MMNLYKTKSLCSEADLCFDNEKYDEAFKLYKEAVTQGETYAVLCLGKMYMSGLGVEQDYSKAIELYLSVLSTYKSIVTYVLEKACMNHDDILWHRNIHIYWPVPKEQSTLSVNGGLTCCLETRSTALKRWPVPKEQSTLSVNGGSTCCLETRSTALEALAST